MANHSSWLLLGLLVLATSELLASASFVPDKFNRTSFPKGFLFGASSSAYQYEGAPDSRGKTIWDDFVRDFSFKIADGSNADVADDFYHRYMEDIKLMKHLGMNVFRFSISWARVLPSGRVRGGVNQKGVDFYNRLINNLIADGIQPFVTLSHFDLPLALEKEYEGFLSPKIGEDFKAYAEFCFKTFGDRVKHWITFNEPYVYIFTGYDVGAMAPGRCSAWRNNSCPAGNSATEPYIAAHNMLIAHAKAAKVYKEKYQASQKGEIGITLVSGWMYPYTKKTLDQKAAGRALDFMYGWFIHPLVYGDYPRSMKALVRQRLPKFTSSEAMLLKGSYDFIALNYYSSNYASHVPFSNKPAHLSFSTDSYANVTSEKNGKPIGKPLGNGYNVPDGLRKVLVYTKENYKNPRMYITENGVGNYNNETVQQGINDPERIEYYRTHLLALNEAIKEGVDVKGFMAWSLLDCWEWSSGFNLRYGLTYVDYNNGQKRYPKDSAIWYKKFLLH
ncbi:beta-glucosidase 12-like [Diospyros lotus]|uniref:beta-glucosidase 12-like n=1 Tax=Diospyros lotus TaxID=55363 RepID=UPI002257D687|nr:beta-glucosidase 12-like [Diospyros lotus]